MHGRQAGRRQKEAVQKHRQQLVDAKLVDQCNKLFDRMDTNGNGVITRDEHRAMFVQQYGADGLTESMIAVIEEQWQRCDPEGTGSITREAFARLQLPKLREAEAKAQEKRAKKKKKKKKKKRKAGGYEANERMRRQLDELQQLS